MDKNALKSPGWKIDTSTDTGVQHENSIEFIEDTSTGDSIFAIKIDSKVWATRSTIVNDELRGINAARRSFRIQLVDNRLLCYYDNTSAQQLALRAAGVSALLGALLGAAVGFAIGSPLASVLACLTAALGGSLGTSAATGSLNRRDAAIPVWVSAEGGTGGVQRKSWPQAVQAASA